LRAVLPPPRWREVESGTKRILENLRRAQLVAGPSEKFAEG
jgi:hypothetical protein